jgi:hypothetical protein
MQSFKIELTEHEQVLLGELRFNIRGMEPDEVRLNGEIAAELAHSVIKRRAVPEHRVRYFTDRDYNLGPKKCSRQEVFEGNGRRGDDILKHPHFLPYLRYFLFGAHLSERVIAEFSSAVRERGSVTSGDVVPLGALARRLARQDGLSRDQSREEFFKLALDCDIDLGSAASIRQSAGQR